MSATGCNWVFAATFFLMCAAALYSAAVPIKKRVQLGATGCLPLHHDAHKVFLVLTLAYIC